MKKNKKLSQLNDAPLTQPQNRTERFLAKIAKLADTAPADTRTRLERYLAAIVQSTAGGGAISEDTETTLEGLLFGNSTTGKVEGVVPEMSAQNVADYLNMVADASEAGGLVDSSQLNKLFVPVDVGPAPLITLEDGVDGAILGKCVVNIKPVQSGSGDPSPTNVRPISGWTGATIKRYGTDESDMLSTYTISFGEAGTVYEGTLDVGTGVLTVTANALTPLTSFTGLFERTSIATVVYASNLTSNKSNCIACNIFRRVSVGISNMNPYDFVGTSGSTSTVSFALPLSITTIAEANEWLANQNAQNQVYILIKLPTPITYQLTPVQVRTLLGQNNIYADCGDVTVQYRGDIPNLYKLIT